MIENFKIFKKTRSSIFNAISAIRGKSSLDSKSIEQFEERLLLSDIGFDLVDEIVQKISKGFKNGIKAEDFLKEIFKDFLSDLKFEEVGSSKIILISGINGTGKTTSCAKLSKYYKNQEKKVCLIAADTFRAAAQQQIQYWAEKNEINCFLKENSKDPSSVIFEGLRSEMSKESDVTIIDTAGRLHTSTNLMSELSKMERVIYKFADFYHSWISLDATTGQNALSQIDLFKKNIKINGIILNKMDGSSKGGVAVPIMKSHKIPIKFIGIGEGDEDIVQFNLDNYLEGLFSYED